MVGLFDTVVDNTEIFKLIGPAFQTVIGGFIGLLAGIKLKNEDEASTKQINTTVGMADAFVREKD
jgi:hypothetical protein